MQLNAENLNIQQEDFAILILKLFITTANLNSEICASGCEVVNKFWPNNFKKKQDIIVKKK